MLVPYALSDLATCLHDSHVCTTVNADDMVRLTSGSLGNGAGSLDQNDTLWKSPLLLTQSLLLYSASRH